MSTSVTYVDPIQPENKMRLYRTKVINIIGGPSCDKSLFSSSIVLKLHLMGKTVEMVPEIAKIRILAISGTISTVLPIRCSLSTMLDENSDLSQLGPPMMLITLVRYRRILFSGWIGST